jgi:hypothetical protein
MVHDSPSALLSPADSSLPSPDQLPHEPIQRYRSYGLSEAAFIHSVIAPFRVSFYVTHDSAALPGPADFSSLHHFDIGTLLIDRTGLAKEFQTADNLARASQSLTFVFPFTSRKEERQSLSLTIHPRDLGSFSLISSKPSYKNLLLHNQKISGRSYSTEDLKRSLVRTLETFVAFNYLTLWVETDTPLPPLITQTKTTKSPSPKEEMEIEKRDSLREESGLVFRKRDTPHSPDPPVAPKIALPVKRELPVKETTPTAGEEVPPICQIPGISGGEFCETYRKKKIQSQTKPPPTPQTPQSTQKPPTELPKKVSPVTGQGSPGSSSASIGPSGRVDEQSKKERLKAMGFTDSMIQKFLTKAEQSKAEAKTSAGRGEGGAELLSKVLSDSRPAICSLPGVNADGICKAYEQSSGRGSNEISREKPKEPTPTRRLTTVGQSLSSTLLDSLSTARPKRVISSSQYQPQSQAQLLATFRNPNCEKLSDFLPLAPSLSSHLSRTSRNGVPSADCMIPTKFKRTSSGPLLEDPPRH